MSPSSVSLVDLIARHHLRIFTTTDFITLSGLEPSAATQSLRRLAVQNLLWRLKRGVWANCLAPNLNPREAVPFLTAPWPSYVSLYSALADYGVIAEIPSIIYAVTSGPRMRHSNSLGVFHVHHIPAPLIWGYEIKKVGQAAYPMAEREKAFLDLVYLSLTPRSRLRVPPTRSRRWNLDFKMVRTFARKFEFPTLSHRIKQLGL